MAMLDFAKWAFNRRADLITFVNTATKLMSTNAQSALVELANRTFETYFEFRFTSSEGTSSTTSNGWTNKFNDTLADIDGGRYLVLFFCEQGSTNKQKMAGMRARVNGITISDVRNGFSVDDEFETRSGFHLMTLTAGPVTLRMQHGQTDSGGTSRIKRARMCLFRIGA